MTSLYIAIPTEAAEKLRELAHRDLRSPRNQAAVLLVEAIHRAVQDLETTQAPVSAPAVPARRRSLR